MRILYENDGEFQVFDDEREFLDNINNDDVQWGSEYSWAKGPTAHYLPDDLKPVVVREVEAPKYSLDDGQTDIPPPLPGETVLCYARRISGGQL